MWALIIINRGCRHEGKQLNESIVQKMLSINSPYFLTFLLHICDPEDTDFTSHTIKIWQTIDGLAKKDNKVLFQQFEDNYALVEKILIGTKRTLHSTTGIAQHMRNTINSLRTKSAPIDAMMKEATKKLSAKPAVP